jgi:RNA polymerase sigma-70 factor (ECF subfamily)
MSSDSQAALRPQAQSRTVRARLDDLARRYYAPLASFFRKRTHNAPEVQDLVQQVFLCLAQYRELGDIEKPDGYIFQTAANTLKDHHRHNAVSERFSKEQLAISGAADSDFSRERVLQGRDTVAQLAHALRQLPERTRDILIAPLLRRSEARRNRATPGYFHSGRRKAYSQSARAP